MKKFIVTRVVNQTYEILAESEDQAEQIYFGEAEGEVKLIDDWTSDVNLRPADE
jgi:hypothetical protein